MNLGPKDFELAVSRCLDLMGQTREEVEATATGGEWFVWTSWAFQPFNDGGPWRWSYRFDFPFVLPPWCDIEAAEGLGDTVGRVRLPEDSRRCHERAHNALVSKSSGYRQAFRLLTRDRNIVWVEERVVMTRLPDGSSFLLGTCSRADQCAIDEALAELERDEKSPPNPPPSEEDLLNAMDVDMLRRHVRKLKGDADLLVRSGQWLIWSAMVRQLTIDPPDFHWVFRQDFTPVLPDWFDADRVVREDLAIMLSRARLEEDAIACGANSTRALSSGASGYRQMFRVRLRHDRVSWVEENVAIQPISEGVWHVVGVCFDATDRKVAEDTLQAQNEDLQNMQIELQAQNEELRICREKLEEDKRAMALANLRLTSLATTDGLTGIKNHRAFQEQLHVELHAAARYDVPVSLILLDVDHFKRLNDEFGHPAGDSVLIDIGRMLQECARECDYVARYGGEEFVVILPRTDGTGAVVLAERFRAALEIANWQFSPVTASFGVATAAPSCASSESLIGRADAALYNAKIAGRNRVVVAPPVLPASDLANADTVLAGRRHRV
jgi:diguanylate cyclase (GGDEF)-like protein